MTNEERRLNIGLLDVYARMDGGIDVLLAIDRVACPVRNKNGLERMKEGMATLTGWASRFSSDEAKGISTAVGVAAKKAIEDFKGRKPAEDEEE